MNRRRRVELATYFDHEASNVATSIVAHDLFGYDNEWAVARNECAIARGDLPAEVARIWIAQNRETRDRASTMRRLSTDLVVYHARLRSYQAEYESRL